MPLPSLRLLALALALAGPSFAGPADGIPQASLLEPKALADQLSDKKAAKSLLLHVGFRSLFDQSHIPGSSYAGPGNSADGLNRLEAALKKAPKTKPIVLYCGCCPWAHCPNVAAAHERVRKLGYKNVKVVKIQEDFGKNWVALGYPVTQGK